MPVMKALKDFPYNKVRLKAGDIFKCKEKHIPVLVHAKLATRPEVEVAKPIPAYQTRHMEAEKPDFVPYMPPMDSRGNNNIIPTSKTVAELRAVAEARGIHLPSGYIPKTELLRIIAKG